MRIFAPYRIAFTFLFLPFFANALEAGDNVVSKEFITEPPTLISLGFEWEIGGDDNRNAEVAVSYRKKGDQIWKQGLPLLRLQGEPTISGPMAYTAPNMFAGSIFDLEPGTEYECRFVLTDPDGVDGKTDYLVTIGTRPEEMSWTYIENRQLGTFSEREKVDDKVPFAFGTEYDWMGVLTRRR